MLYFGSDRLDNSGDAQQGFWFFQNSIALGSNSVGGGSGFTSVHRAGDLLVISDFSNGGTTSTITVYKWDPTCKKTGGTCGDANLRTLDASGAPTLLIEAPPETNEWLAVRDRLQRATHGSGDDAITDLD